MTRATLLHALARPSALGPADVRELEQLAQAFPYCQTAHLLLAKAAHDHGTMLAGQRLRRAATYAADRTLLRRLIEQAEIEQVEPETAQAPAAVEEVAVRPVASAAAVETEASSSAADFFDAEALVAPPPMATAAEPVAAPAAELPAPKEAPTAIATEPFSAPVPEQGVALTDSPSVTVEAEAAPATEEATVAEADTSALFDKEGVELPAAAALPEYIPALIPEDEELPALAPAIRPPVEVGEARFEFGLAEAPPPPAPAYELPGLVDEWAAAAATLSLGSREPLAETEAHVFAPDLLGPEVPIFTPAAFTGDAAVGYGFGESSRLGFSLQLLDLLTDKAEAVEGASAAAAQPPAAPLPPVGAFFEPDPLLLDYWATHCPPPPALPTSLDLINNFLRRQPRLTRPAMLPPSPAAQADLSVRSTRAEPDLVSESLARIFVRQGKNVRAIEIYEKLMAKQPEKAAYFEAQIQQLQLQG